MRKRESENQNIEYKECWRDEYLKEICAFANASGGCIFIGVNDKQNVVGISDAKKLMEDIPNKIANCLGIVSDIKLLKNKTLQYIKITVEQSSMPISYKGAYYRRSGSTKQELRGSLLQEFFFKKIGLSWDNVINKTAKIGDIDKQAIDYFLGKAVEAKRMTSISKKDSNKKVLSNLNLIDENERLKNAAILLFGKKPSKFFSSLSIEFRIGRFGINDTDLMFQDVVGGNIIQMADRVIEILKSKYLISPIHYKGLQRIEPLEIPEDALREAIFNSIIHKDYMGVHIQMKVYADRITLWNEGKLPEGYTIRKLLGKHSSKPRNKNIADVFYKAGFIESWGRGIDKIRDSVKKAGMQTPSFRDTGDGIEVTLYRKNDTANDTVNDTVKLSVLEATAFEIIKHDRTVRYSSLMLALHKSRPTIARTLRSLQEKHIIERSGSDKDGFWKISNN